MQVEQVRRAMRDLWEVEADGVWQAPGRVNLIGEHTDYNDGLALPIALPRSTYAAVRRRPDNLLRLHSLDVATAATESIELSDVAPGRPQGWAEYAAGVVWALREAGYPVSGLDVVVSSEVPIGAGLSSSAALEGAVAAAGSDLFDLGLLTDDTGRARLAAACQRAENEIAQAPTGGMDQAASLRARAAHALLLDCRDGSISHVPFDLAGHGLTLLVINTRAAHALVDGQYGQRRAACEQAVALLGVPSLREVQDGQEQALPENLRPRVRHVVTEIARVAAVVDALRDEDFARVGALFTQSHTSLRDDYQVSCPELDAAVESATAAGALGARMTGGGFGGSAIALVAETEADAVAEVVRRRFADEGWRDPEIFAATAAGPADRVPPPR